MTNALSFDVEKGFGDFKLSAKGTFRPGITALYGPSGSGKTTLLNLLAGIDKPDDGAIALGDKHFFNKVMKVDLVPEKRSIGFVFQDDALFPHYSVRENLAFGAEQSKKSPDWGKLVDLFGLKGLLERRPATLSGGEKKRVAIARALLSGPEILLLDEPLANIDARRREAFFPYLDSLREEFDMPIVYVTHQLEEVLRLANYMVFLRDGEILEDGPLADVFATHAFQETLPAVQRGVLLEGRVMKADGGLAKISIPGGELYSAEGNLRPGNPARIRLLAKDVAVALKKPGDISILNILPCTIADLDQTLSGHIELDLEISEKTGPTSLIKAEITPRSAEVLNLKKGMKIYALVKALAIISPGV